MYRKIKDLVQQAEKLGVPISEIVLRSEIEQNSTTREVVTQQMQHRLEVMRTSTRAGLEAPIHSRSGLTRGSAHRFWGWLEGEGQPITGPVLSRALARALSTAEVNAGMGCIVATPTAGSAGILPAVLVTLQEAYHYPDEALISALFTAAGIGMVIATRAQIAGAAGGCQAETGSAAAMTAGAVVELRGGSPRQSAQAVAIALKNMLGLVCDPVAGMVEVPCVKRNAAGVGQCFVAVDLAMAGVESAIPADEVIDAMGRIGAHMDERLRETAMGGLAATPTGKALAQEIWSRKS